MSWLTPQRRGWIYRLLAAAAPLAVAYGLLSGEQASMWIGLAAALAGTGLAAAHTPGPGEVIGTVEHISPAPDIVAQVAAQAEMVVPALVREAADRIVPDLVDVAVSQVRTQLDDVLGRGLSVEEIRRRLGLG